MPGQKSIYETFLVYIMLSYSSNKDLLIKRKLLGDREGIVKCRFCLGAFPAVLNV
jgi:hypothetical protein